MIKLLPMLIGGFFWAAATQWSTHGSYRFQRQPLANKIAFAMLIISLALPIGLRVTYNDTGTYIRTFQTSGDLAALFSSDELHILRNPAFVFYRCLIKTFTTNHTIFFLFAAFFVQYSYMRFLRRHCENFLLGVFLFFCLGTYTFSIAAMKQTIAMAILLYAVDDLIDRRTSHFYLKVFMAFLFHTYALIFLILPFFTSKPWTYRTFLLLGGILFVMSNFDTVIESFLEIANESGKSVSGSEILGTASINPIRVAVYAVTPLFALVFRRYLFSGPENREQNILVNMSIISVSIMSVGLVSAANMFARMAQYFEFGLLCSLPWMLDRPFEKNSARLITLIAICCFTGFFIYAQIFWMPFDDHFGRYTVMEFLQSIWEEAVFG